ncbi:hypothetical protein Hdeb2414_s0021g00578961 [Helianthus debilis subsp. tardiflorus]
MNRPNELTDLQISNEMEAIAVAYHIIRNVAMPGFTYIEDTDLRRFMIKEEVDVVFPLIDVADTGQIDRKTLTEWVPATSEFIVRDTGNRSPRYMRCTINQIACTSNILTTSGMQLALLVQPLALPHLSEEPIQVMHNSDSYDRVVV